MPNQELKPRIVVAVREDEDTYADATRGYHLSIKISDTLIERLLPVIMITIGEQYYRDALGAQGHKLLQDLFDTDTVREMHFWTHSLSVYRERRSSWKETNEKVLTVLKSRFPRPEQVEVLELNRNNITLEHYHPEDSARPDFRMPA